MITKMLANKLEALNTNKGDHSRSFKDIESTKKYKKYKSDEYLNLKTKYFHIKTSVNSFIKSNSNDVINDPLGAFSKNKNSYNVSFFNNNSIENRKNKEQINKRLFDYEPFSDEKKKNSDFLYEKNQTNCQEIIRVDSDYEYENNGNYDYEDEEEKNDDDDDDSNEYNDYGDDDDYDNYDDDCKESNESIDYYNDEKVNENNFDIKSDKNILFINNLENTPETSVKENNFETETNVQSNITNNKSNTSAVTSLFSSFRKKVVTSIDINKIKEIITDKSLEIKDVIMTPINQQELTNRLRSFSGYQLTPKQYVNNFAKSTSSQFMSENFQKILKKNSNQNDDMNNHISQYNEIESFPDDDSFKQLNLKWWGFDYDGRKINQENKYNDFDDNILLDIQISSCNLYD
jgi:hypothetical protein